MIEKILKFFATKPEPSFDWAAFNRMRESDNLQYRLEMEQQDEQISRFISDWAHTLFNEWVKSQDDQKKYGDIALLLTPIYIRNYTYPIPLYGWHGHKSRYKGISTGNFEEEILGQYRELKEAYFEKQL